MIENMHKVDKKQWTRWNEQSKNLFNGLYEYMGNNQYLFNHPHTIQIPNEYWNTTAWNAAYMAAELIRKETINGKEEEG